MKNNYSIIINALTNSSFSNYRIAQETGISEPTIAKYRKNITKPSVGNLTILANYFSIKPNDRGELIVENPRTESKKNDAGLLQLIENNTILVLSNQKLVETNQKLVDQLLDQLAHNKTPDQASVHRAVVG